MFARMASVDDDIQMVRDLIAWAGSNAAQVAAAIGKPNTTINRFANGSAKHRLHRETLQALRDKYPDFPGFAALPPSNATVVRFEGETLERPEENLPVWGTGLGASRMFEGEAIEQTDLNSGDTLEWVRRPTVLKGKKNVYGLHVQGGSMHPALPDGELVIAGRDLPLSIGDNVVVYLKARDEGYDGERARGVLVKELVRRSASFVELRQYDPALVFRVPMEEVSRIDRILTRREMLS
jgi:phage repressor protein C with HTH and peptisase S24 domain